MRTIESGARHPLSWPLLYARRMRAYTARILHGWASLLALVLVGGALVLAASGHTVVGCLVLIVGIMATWLGEVWVSPRGDDAYARRMRDILRASSADVNASRALQRDRLRQLRSVVVGRESTLYVAERQREVCDRMRELERIESESGDALEDRAVRMHAIHQELSRAVEDLKEGPSEPCIVQMKHDLEDYLRGAADARSAVRELVERDWERLQRVKPPAYRRESHMRYASIASDYLTALREFTTALEDRSDDAIRDAAERMSSRQRDMDESARAYLRRLGDRYAGRY